MKHIIFKDKYPVWSIEFKKSEVEQNSVDEIIEYFKTKIENHTIGTFIAIFDHYAHTTSIPEHKVADEIKALKNIIFCFGKEIPKPIVGAVRPRSISVCELEDSFEISSMEAPNEAMNAVMQNWAIELKKSI